MDISQRNIKLTLEYDGTDWHGWQIQENAPTVQGELEKAIAAITQERRRVTGASRTDAGVHARGQVCNFYTNSRLPIDRFPRALNSQLPASIVVLSAEEVEPAFHARLDAAGKKYSYEILNRSAPSALLRHQSYHVMRSLDKSAMRQAASFLIGQHDFAAFQAAGSSVRNTIRHVWRLELLQLETDRLSIIVEGNGFLYNMVRIMVGTLLWVGSGRLTAEQIPVILASRDRTLAGPTAPAQGLCLEKVYYEQ